MAVLTIGGMKFYAYHGYYKEETLKGGEYIVDVEIHLPDSLINESITLEETVNYEAVHEIVNNVMQEATPLIEQVAAKIKNALEDGCLRGYPFKIRLKKLNPPLKGETAYTMVEV
jgi:7,8-dihydroneopterin aldolase/epimerase/oxygenase